MSIEGCIDYLREHGKQIGMAANAGNKMAQKIVAAYQMVHASSGDQIAQELLEEYLTEWRAEATKAATNG